MNKVVDLKPSDFNLSNTYHGLLIDQKIPFINFVYSIISYDS